MFLIAFRHGLCVGGYRFKLNRDVVIEPRARTSQ
jgi:hypothetical protein